jgi:hypothetical protein
MRALREPVLACVTHITLSRKTREPEIGDDQPKGRSSRPLYLEPLTSQENFNAR